MYSVGASWPGRALRLSTWWHYAVLLSNKKRKNNNNDNKTLPYSDTVSSSMHWGLEIKGRFGDGYLKFVFSVCSV